MGGVCCVQYYSCSCLQGLRVWNGRQVQDTGAGSPSGGLGGALLGPEKSGASTWMGVWLLVFLWLFGCWIVDASIFVAVLLRSFSPCFVEGGVVCFCCVCVCGDKL